jgi:hypothetical protein
VTLFNESPVDRNFCRLVLNGDAQLTGLKGADLFNARTGCQCALAAAIFDGLSVYTPTISTEPDNENSLDGKSGTCHYSLETNEIDGACITRWQQKCGVQLKNNIYLTRTYN